MSKKKERKKYIRTVFYKRKLNKMLAIGLLEKYNKLEMFKNEKGSTIYILDIDFLLNKLIETEKELKLKEITKNLTVNEIELLK